MQFRPANAVYWALGVLWIGGCQFLPFNHVEWQCRDDTGCFDEFACHPLTEICVPRVPYGCDSGICPSQIRYGDPCSTPTAFIPCSDDGIGCENSCRTCADDRTWGRCRSPFCELGTAASCSSCADDCGVQVHHARATCETVNGQYQCAYSVCEVGFMDADGDVTNGCEAACPTTEICDNRDNDCDRLVDNLTPAEEQSDCGAKWPDAADVDRWACSVGRCAPAQCVAGTADDNADPADGCEAVCVVDGAEVCDYKDNDCDGIVDNEAAAGCTNFSTQLGSTADVRCLCRPAPPYIYPVNTPCGDGVCAATEDCGSCPADCGACNDCGDGVCNGNDTSANCPQDCGPSCGDGVCNGGEECATCAADCGECPTCGDGSCNGQEDTVQCPQDCGTRCGDGACNGAESCSDCQGDCGDCPVCGDGQCNGNDTTANCPADCGSRCGDGACNGDEDCAACASDCGACPFCGDGVCNGSESPVTCPEDCPGVCGDGKCSGAESCTSCPEDCGTPSCAGDLCGQDDGCGSPCPSDDLHTCGKCGVPECIGVNCERLFYFAIDTGSASSTSPNTVHFPLQLQEGIQYTIETCGLAYPYPDHDTYLRLSFAGGEIAESDDACGVGESQLVFTAESDGLFDLSAGCYGDRPCVSELAITPEPQACYIKPVSCAAARTCGTYIPTPSGCYCDLLCVLANDCCPDGPC